LSIEHCHVDPQLWALPFSGHRMQHVCHRCRSLPCVGRGCPAQLRAVLVVAEQFKNRCKSCRLLNAFHDWIVFLPDHIRHQPEKKQATKTV